MNKRTIYLLIACSIGCSWVSLGGQQDGGTESQLEKLDAASKLKIVEAVAGSVLENYVFPDVGKKVAENLLKRLSDKDYDGIDDLVDLARVLTADMQSVSGDLHMGVTVRGRAGASQGPPEVQWSEQYLEWQRFQNYGFKKVDRLLGNVGFIALDEFVFPEMEGRNVAGETARAAMTFISDCYALIFDLRDNFGGREEMALLLLSYLFEQPVHILTHHNRVKGTNEIWTPAREKGQKWLDMPVYVLTSGHTISGGEMFAFVLQNRKRAVVIGETTRGAAHKTRLTFMPDLGINVAIPHSASVDPLTGTDWEGKGVEPDFSVDPGKAKYKAHSMALKHVLDSNPSSMERREIEWALMEVEADLNPVSQDEVALEDYVGDFGQRKITAEKGALIYQREGGPAHRLRPMSKDLFAFESEAMFYVRIRFGRDESGCVDRMILLYDVSPSQEFVKTGK